MTEQYSFIVGEVNEILGQFISKEVCLNKGDLIIKPYWQGWNRGWLGTVVDICVFLDARDRINKYTRDTYTNVRIKPYFRFEVYEKDSTKLIVSNNWFNQGISKETNSSLIGIKVGSTELIANALESKPFERMNGLANWVRQFIRPYEEQLSKIDVNFTLQRD